MKLITVIFLLLMFLFPIESTFGQNVPKFWVKSLEGKRFSSKKIKSPYVISFFFVHCVPCIKEIPLLHKFMSTNYPDAPLLFIIPLKKILRMILKISLNNWMYLCHISTKIHLDRSQRNSLKAGWHSQRLLGLKGRDISSDTMGLMKRLYLK